MNFCTNLKFFKFCGFFGFFYFLWIFGNFEKSWSFEFLEIFSSFFGIFEFFESFEKMWIFEKIWSFSSFMDLKFLHFWSFWNLIKVLCDLPTFESFLHVPVSGTLRSFSMLWASCSTWGSAPHNHLDQTAVGPYC